MSDRYALHGQESESVLDCDTGIIITTGDREDAALLRDQLNAYESRLDALRARCHQEHEARIQMEHELSEAGCATVADLVARCEQAEQNAALYAKNIERVMEQRDHVGTIAREALRPLRGARNLVLLKADSDVIDAFLARPDVAARLKEKDGDDAVHGNG